MFGDGIRRRSIAVLALVALVAGLGVVVVEPEPADATIFNIIPTHESGDPTDDFVDGEAIWAYITSDFGGGVACVVPASTDISNSDGSCKKPAMGKRQPIGAAFGVWLPIVAPDLKTGQFRLLADNGDQVGDDRLSVEFSVQRVLAGRRSLQPRGQGRGAHRLQGRHGIHGRGARAGVQACWVSSGTRRHVGNAYTAGVAMTDAFFLGTGTPSEPDTASVWPSRPPARTRSRLRPAR